MGDEVIIENGNYSVYIHTNKTNGKRYVGITCQKPEERWRRGKGYKHCPVFYKAILKYGWDSFEHDVFASHLTKEEAENMERVLIKELETLSTQNGYNVSEGGDAPFLSEETKQKISESHMGELNPMYGKKHTEEQKQHLRQMMTGERNPRYGKEVSEETRRKISLSNKGRPCSLTEEQKIEMAKKVSEKLKGRPRPEGGGRKPKKILCVETGEIFESVASAARNVGTSKTNICSCAKGKHETVKGFHWEYCEEKINNS